MAYPVYSKRFMCTTGGADAIVYYTVPAGYVALVEKMDGVMIGTIAASDYLAISIVSGGTDVLVSCVPPADFGAGANFQWVGTQVLNAGDQIAVVGTKAYSVTVSGKLLTNP